MAAAVRLLLVVASCCCLLVLGHERGERRRGVRQRADEAPPLSLIGPGVRLVNGSATEIPVLEVTSARPEERFRNSDATLANVASLLQRQAERLSVLQSLAEQQMRRLDGLEYRLTRLEVQGQERGEATRVAVAETARHVQTLTYQGGQLSSAIESLRQNQAEERQTLATLITAGVSPASQAGGFSGAAEVLSRLQAVTNSVQGVRTAVTSLGEQHAVFMRNFTSLANVTSQIRSGQQQLVTRHMLAASLAELHLSTPRVWPLQESSQESRKLPTDCSAVQREVGYNKSGVYLLQPHLHAPPFFVFCDLGTRGGGWTVVQHRFEGSVDFYRDWQDYKRGFGNLGGEFWLGLDKLHHLTNSEVNELLVELQDFTLDTSHAHYSAFAVGPEVEGYPISFLAGYDGDAGDSLVYHAGMKFSTKDADNDQWVDGNCAESHTGAWWYNGCDTSNLNGRYLNGALPESHEYQGMYWYDWRGPTYSLMRTRMMVRPRVAPAQVEIKTSTTKAPKRSGRQRSTSPTPIPEVITTASPDVTSTDDTEVTEPPA